MADKDSRHMAEHYFILRSPFPDVTFPVDRSLPEFVLSKAATYGDRVAFIDDKTGTKVTYGDYTSRCYRLAAGLHHLGLDKGQVVAICSPNSLEYPVVFHAVMLCGGVIAGLVPTFSAAEATPVLKNANPRYIFSVPEKVVDMTKAVQDCSAFQEIIVIGDDSAHGCTTYASLLDNDFLPPEVAIDVATDAAVITYTSGTTGERKGAISTHKSYIVPIVQGERYPEVSMFRRDEVTIMNRPLTHNYGQVFYSTMGLYWGATCVLIEDDHEVERILEAIQKYKVTLLGLTPLPVAQMAKYKPLGRFDTSSLRHVVCGGAPLSEAVYKLFNDIYKVDHFMNAYGMTETAVIAVAPLGYKGSSVGLPVANVQIKIVDIATQKSLASNCRGEIWAKTESTFTSYMERPDLTAKSLTEDGWFKTGDVGYYDDDGFLYIVDRLKEIIDFDAVKIPPAEVESVLLREPDILEVCVVGYPDEDYGELPRAYVLRRPNSDLNERQVHRLISDHLDDTRRLRGGVVFVDDFPRTTLGKVMRAKVKAMMLQEIEREKSEHN